MIEDTRSLEDPRCTTDVAEPFRGCPEFEACSVNSCRLHPAYPRLATLADDTETRCTARRSTRVRIAALHPGMLPFGGLTDREHRRKLRRGCRSQEEIERVRLRMDQLRQRKQIAGTNEPAVGR